MDDERLEKALHFIRVKAQDYAQAKANRVYLSEFKKSKRSLLMREAELEGFKTAAMQEREAYAHPEYIEVLEGLKVAVEKEVMFEHQMKAAEMTVDVWRTEQANKRAERGRYGA